MDCSQLETQREQINQSIEGKGSPPNDPAFEKWVKSLERYLPSGLEKLETEFTAKLRGAKSASAKAELQRRLKAVREQRQGPDVIDDPPPPKPIVRVEEDKPMSEADILEGAEYLLAIGKPHMLTESQKAALKRKECAK